MEHSHIHRFSKDLCDWKNTDQKTAKKYLGGKGAGLVTMVQAGLPVPPGFTITTEVCNDYSATTQPKVFLNLLMERVKQPDLWLASQFGHAPLVSVRSGAPISMPGMMDTILNVGLTEDNLQQWATRIGSRAAMDSYRRLIQMLGATAYGVPSQLFEDALAHRKKQSGVTLDADLPTEDLNILGLTFLAEFKKHTGHAFPQTRDDQMEAAVSAVFKSWMNPRAIEYRKINKIDQKMGTAVTVQAMVFGNMGEDSGTGVLFTRDPSTGDKEVLGEFLTNAQGEDVVAGIRTPFPLNKMLHLGPAWLDTLDEIFKVCDGLEKTYADMVDIEFTVQQGTLYILQSRTGKRSAQAAFKIAVDLVSEQMISEGVALSRITPDQFKIMKRPSLSPTFKVAEHYKGLPACPGVVTGRPVFSAQEAVDAKDAVILVTHETTPDDIAGMNAAKGILTQTGGATSHAAVVARSMDKPCVVGCTDLDMTKVKACSKITIEGATGRVWLDIDVPVVDGADSEEVKTVVEWCLAKSKFVLADSMLPDTPRKMVLRTDEWFEHLAVWQMAINEIQSGWANSGLVIDVRRPETLIGSTDADLLDLFGGTKSFNTLADRVTHCASISGMLIKMLNKTLGVKVLVSAGDNGYYPMLYAAGYVTETLPNAAPADYIVFDTLSN